MAGLDTETLTGLMREYGPRLLLFAGTWTRHPEDAVQEAFLALALRKTVPDHTTAWLFGAVRQQALQMVRAECRRERRQLEVGKSVAGPPQTLLAADQRLDAETALAILDAEHREIVVARIWGGLSFEEIGRLTGLSAATAWRRHEEALAQLKNRLEDQ